MTKETVNDLRMKYAGAIGLLCEASVYIRNHPEGEDIRESIERAVADWCKTSGWTWKRTLSRIEVSPP